MKKLLAAILTISLGAAALGQGNATQETLGIIKNNLEGSKEKIKKYEWVETTTTFVKGEQKSKSQNQCYYGVDGKLYKVATGAAESAKKPGGLRGKIAENKKEDMQDYIEKAVAKIHTYLPPDGSKLQQIYGSGKAVIHVIEPGKKFKLDFPDYMQKGDMISISADKEKNIISAVSVSTYIDDPSDKVTFDINYSALPDGTQYPGETKLDVQAKQVKINIQNDGFKNAAGR